MSTEVGATATATAVADRGTVIPDIGPGLSKEVEITRAMTGPVARVLVASATGDHMRFHPGNITPLDHVHPQESEKLRQAKGLSKLAYDAAREVSLESRRDAKNYATWEKNTTKWVTYYADNDDDGMLADRKAAFKAIGIIGPDGKVTVGDFYTKYLDGKADIEGFVEALTKDITTDGVVNMVALQNRLKAIAPLLKSFGDEIHHANLMVRDFAIAHAMLTQPEEARKYVVSHAADHIVKLVPDTDPEGAYLQALERKAKELAKPKDKPPAPETQTVPDPLPVIDRKTIFTDGQQVTTMDRPIGKDNASAYLLSSTRAPEGPGAFSELFKGLDRSKPYSVVIGRTEEKGFMVGYRQTGGDDKLVVIGDRLKGKVGDLSGDFYISSVRLHGDGEENGSTAMVTLQISGKTEPQEISLGELMRGIHTGDLELELSKERYPRPTPRTGEVSSQQDRHTYRVEGREGQPGMTIRMGGESVGKDPTKKNQDAMWFDASKMAGFVSDGMGVYPDGDRASRVIGESMQRSFENIPPLPSLQAAGEWLRRQVMAANQALKAEQDKPQDQDPIDKSAGATLTAMFVWTGPNGERVLITANVGDSRLSLVRKDKMRDLTLDQSGLRIARDTGGKIHWRSDDEARELQERYSAITDPSTLTGEDKKYWDERSQMLFAVDGRLAEPNIEVKCYSLTYGSTIRILGRSDGLTDVTTDADTMAAIKGITDPQDAAHALIERARKDDQSPRQKISGPDDKSIFVMDIILDTPPISEIESGSAEPITYDDERLVQILLNRDREMYQQLIESIPRDERQPWDTKEQEDAKRGMRRLYEVVYEAFPLLLPGSTYEDAQEAFFDKGLSAERDRARSHGRKLVYQFGSFSKSHFLHFGVNFDPSPGTTDAFSSAHRIYVVPKSSAVGEVAAEVIHRAREKGYEPYGKVWDDALEVDTKELSRRKDRILFLPRTQTQQDIILAALKEIQDAHPEFFEDNPLLLSDPAIGLRGVGIAEEPVQKQDDESGVYDKKSFNNTREELLLAVREYILSTRVGPRPDDYDADKRIQVLQARLKDGTLQMDDFLTLVRKVIRGFAPRYNVDPDHISRNLPPRSSTSRDDIPNSDRAA